MDPHSACNTYVFTDMEQVDACANSKQYKQTGGRIYALFGFIISIILTFIIINMFATESTESGSTGYLSSKMRFGIAAVFVGFVTYMAYNYGYSAADYNSVLMAYQQDKQELDSRKGFASRESNIADLVQDRKNIASAYNQGRSTGRNNRSSFGNNSGSGTRFNFGNFGISI